MGWSPATEKKTRKSKLEAHPRRNNHAVANSGSRSIDHGVTWNKLYSIAYCTRDKELASRAGRNCEVKTVVLADMVFFTLARLRIGRAARSQPRWLSQLARQITIEKMTGSLLLAFSRVYAMWRFRESARWLLPLRYGRMYRCCNRSKRQLASYSDAEAIGDARVLDQLCRWTVCFCGSPSGSRPVVGLLDRSSR